MKSKSLFFLSILCTTNFISCSQDQDPTKINKTEPYLEKVDLQERVPHNYGGWYCPDNLNGFPAVNLSDWDKVPVVNGRMPTEEESRNGTSLILVDMDQHPNAKPLELQMPQLARFYNQNSGKNEIIIVIQAVNISNDSIVGFRYLNGGNGSARFNEVDFISENEVDALKNYRFVTFNLYIDATQAEIWEVMTKAKYSKALQGTFDVENKLNSDWNKSSKVNFIYPKAGKVTSAFADNLYGNQYIQLDFESEEKQYVEKFLLLNNEETKMTELKVVCGPYGDDYEKQKNILTNWAQKVKTLSENKVD